MTQGKIAGFDRIARAVVDVGGSTLSAQRVKGAPLPEYGPVWTGPAPSASKFDDVVDGLTDAVHSCSPEKPGMAVFSVPGPFDYESGMWLRHKGKYAACFGLPLGRTLTERLGTQVVFVNDGEAFGRGAGLIFPESRVLAVSLGTGAAAVVCQDGKVDTRIPSVPGAGLDGLSYARFGDRLGIVAPCAAGRWWEPRFMVEDIHGAVPGTSSVYECAEIAALARRGDGAARTAWDRLDKAWSQVLRYLVKQTKATAIVLGGGIAGAIDLLPQSRNTLAWTVESSVFAFGSATTLRGAAALAAETGRRGP